MEQANPLPNTPITLPTMTTPPINPSSSKKPVLIILLVVFVIVLISLYAYLFMKLQNPPPTPIASPAPVVQASPTPTPDPTANWKTYISKCGLEFKYPPFWKAESYFISDSENACGYLTGPDYTTGLDSRTGTYITFSRYLVGKDGINTLDDFIHRSEKFIQPKQDPIQSVSKIIEGFDVEEFTAYGYDPGVSTAFIKGNYIYDIDRSSQTPEKYVDQILSTFKFLE